MDLLRFRSIEPMFMTFLPVSTGNTALHEPGAANLSRLFRLVQSQVVRLPWDAIMSVIESVYHVLRRSGTSFALTSLPRVLTAAFPSLPEVSTDMDCGSSSEGTPYHHQRFGSTQWWSLPPGRHRPKPHDARSFVRKTCAHNVCTECSRALNVR